MNNENRTPPIGACIYCGSQESLQEEHVVPYGLGGDLILPDASCKKCADITSQHELILRDSMQEARAHLGIRTRRPKKRPKAFPLQVESEGSFKCAQVPLEWSPGILVLPPFSPAGFLEPRPIRSGVVVKGDHTLVFVGQNPEVARHYLGVSAIRKNVSMNPSTLARMVAKIGYCYLVFHCGPIPRNEVPVIPIILGTADECGHWVGCWPPELTAPGADTSHALNIKHVDRERDGIRTRITLVYIRLFANFPTPEYHVVARLQRTPSND